MSTDSPALDKLDPREAWQPWQPTAADPWGRKWAAHLYRRAAFGANRGELLEAVQFGFEGTVNLLLNGKSQSEVLLKSLDDDGLVAIKGGLEGIQSWWVYRMLRGPYPLQEKMTLFWHNHFATSIAKVQSESAMEEQNLLLRKHALGKFGPFLQAMSKDEAMLKWLDSNSNIKGKPNENFARELMELFSLGVGNYSEKDIREAARAFTGWHTSTSGFRFNAALHDDGIKSVLGQTGVWDGTDVVRIVLEQPAAARFIVRKLYQFLVAETAIPPNALIEPLCEAFRKSDYDIATLVKTILTSRHFYSNYAFRQRIKSPVEYVLGAVRAIYRQYDEEEADYSPLRHKLLLPYLTAMGQTLFAPPNVKGWPGVRAWLNTTTVLERDNFAAAVASGTLWSKTPQKDSNQSSPPTALDPVRLLREEKVSNAEDVVRTILDLFVPGGVRPEAKAKLETFLTEGKPTGSGLDRRAREVVHAVMTMPEYQLA